MLDLPLYYNQYITETESLSRIPSFTAYTYARALTPSRLSSFFHIILSLRPHLPFWHFSLHDLMCLVRRVHVEVLVGKLIKFNRARCCNSWATNNSVCLFNTYQKSLAFGCYCGFRFSCSFWYCWYRNILVSGHQMWILIANGFIYMQSSQHSMSNISHKSLSLCIDWWKENCKHAFPTQIPRKSISIQFGWHSFSFINFFLFFPPRPLFE